MPQHYSSSVVYVAVLYQSYVVSFSSGSHTTAPQSLIFSGDKSKLG
jgi:hypothetical protein